MKLLTYLFTLFFVFNAIAVAPYGIKGQTQSGTLYSNVHQFPNNLVTNMGGINALVETGNKNILVNPSFEHAIFSTGWTNSAGTFAEDLVVEIDGLKAAKVTLSSQTLDLSQDSTLYQAQFADGVQGLASVRVKTSVAGLRVCSRQNGVINSNLCVSIQANGKWGLYKVPFTLGGTSNGISINSNGTSVTGDVYIDDAFVGAVDLSATVDASRIAGESYFAGTTSCTWSRTSTTIGAFGATAACPGPTIVRSSLGSWQTTDSNLPRQTINNLPAGIYKVKFIFNQANSVNAGTAIAINDGTTTCEPLRGSNTNPVQSVAECTFNYTQSGDRVFELYGASSSGQIDINNEQTSPRSSVKFILEYFGSSTTYSSTNADTDWASCGHTTSDFTGFGTVTNIETQCKRQGSDLLMKGKFITGTPTAVEARLNLKFGGVSLTSKDTTAIPSLQKAGDATKAGSSATYFRTAVLIEPSVGYVTWTNQTSSTGAVVKYQGSNLTGSSEIFMFDARIPIAGWENSNIIIGQFNGLESCTDTYQCTDVFSAKVSSAGVVSSENVDWISGNCSVATTSAYTCTFNTSLFTLTPNCQITADINSASGFLGQIEASSSSSITSRLKTDSGGNIASAFVLTCQKQGADYIGKTAKAVASDQNLRTPGKTNEVIVSATVTDGSGTTTMTDVDDNFISGVCTNPSSGNYVCTFTSNYWASTPKCWAQLQNNQRYISQAKNGSNSIEWLFYNSSVTLADPTTFDFYCKGTKK